MAKPGPWDLKELLGAGHEVHDATELCEYPLHELLQFLGKTSSVEPYEILDAMKRAPSPAGRR